jgi:molecular chaperone IbpA
MNHAFKDFDKFFVGFDKVAEKLADQSVKLAQNYPPFNVKKIDDNKYSIEIAVAGFAKQDIDVELANSTLIVKGTTSSEESKEEGNLFPSYIWKGVSNKPFTRQFTLADNIEIQGADLVNGMLKIWLEAMTPEKTLGKKIPVKEGK